MKKVFPGQIPISKGSGYGELENWKKYLGSVFCKKTSTSSYSYSNSIQYLIIFIIVYESLVWMHKYFAFYIIQKSESDKY